MPGPAGGLGTVGIAVAVAALLLRQCGRKPSLHSGAPSSPGRRITFRFDKIRSDHRGCFETHLRVIGGRITNLQVAVDTLRCHSIAPKLRGRLSSIASIET